MNDHVFLYQREKEREKTGSKRERDRQGGRGLLTKIQRQPREHEEILAILHGQVELSPHERNRLLARSLIVSRRHCDVGLLLVALAVVREVQSRDGEDGAHEVVAPQAHAHHRRAQDFAHARLTGQRREGERRVVVHELEISHVEPAQARAGARPKAVGGGARDAGARMARDG